MKLSAPQCELLNDIATHEQMFITDYTKWDRTARSLINKELAIEQHYTGCNQYEIKITDKGRKEATARGMIK